MLPVTVIFDIGKTNKKCFLFDDSFKVIHREVKVFPEIIDEDGHPTEDLRSLRYWIFDTIEHLAHEHNYHIKALNFSTYGASLVHLDENERIVTPMYSYTKEMPSDVIDDFISKYGDQVFVQTGSPSMGFLNSGLQLYWLKHKRPETLSRIRHSLHFPQYLSSLFSGSAASELTSIGCHTALWHHAKHQYHQWVYKEELDQFFPEIIPTESFVERRVNHENARIGVGIHDSSAALLPYLLTKKRPFILLSTGTWSIGLNPFIDVDSIQISDPILYLNVFGKSVLSSRLFLGKEYSHQIDLLSKHFKKKKSKHKRMRFRKKWFRRGVKRDRPRFEFEYLGNEVQYKRKYKSWKKMKSFNRAYHRLMYQLMKIQCRQVKVLIGKTSIKRIYIDGGFAKNDHFVSIMRLSFPKLKIRTTENPLGSALGAALIVNADQVNVKHLKKLYKSNRK